MLIIETLISTYWNFRCTGAIRRESSVRSLQMRLRRRRLQADLPEAGAPLGPFYVFEWDTIYSKSEVKREPIIATECSIVSVRTTGLQPRRYDRHRVQRGRSWCSNADTFTFRNG